MKIIRNCCRIIVGIVFIYSGFVKGIDPLGSMYKFTDYFNAFGIGWASTCSLFLSFVLSLAEFLVGTALLFNACTRMGYKRSSYLHGNIHPANSRSGLNKPGQRLWLFRRCDRVKQLGNILEKYHSPPFNPHAISK